VPRVQAAVPQSSRNRPRTGRRNSSPAATQLPGLRERKKARLRQQIIETAIRLFRKQGYENTRVDDIVNILEISQPTFFRYFPSKDAVLRDVGQRGFECIAERLKSELTARAVAPSLSHPGMRGGKRPSVVASGRTIWRHGCSAVSGGAWSGMHRGRPASRDTCTGPETG